MRDAGPTASGEDAERAPVLVSNSVRAFISTSNTKIYCLGGSGSHAQPQEQDRASGATKEAVAGERLKSQDHDLHRTAIVRQRKQHHVELATVQRLDEAVRQILDEIQLEAAIGLTQAGQNPWQQEGANGGNDPQPQNAGKRLARGARDLHQLFGRLDNPARALRRLDADGREDDTPLAAIDERRLKYAFELLDARAQRRLVT
jgi:hypothetical protein